MEILQLNDNTCIIKNGKFYTKYTYEPIKNDIYKITLYYSGYKVILLRELDAYNKCNKYINSNILTSINAENIKFDYNIYKKCLVHNYDYDKIQFFTIIFNANNNIVFLKNYITQCNETIIIIILKQILTIILQLLNYNLILVDAFNINNYAFDKIKEKLYLINYSPIYVINNKNVKNKNTNDNMKIIEFIIDQSILKCSCDDVLNNNNNNNDNNNNDNDNNNNNDNNNVQENVDDDKNVEEDDDDFQTLDIDLNDDDDEDLKIKRRINYFDYNTNENIGGNILIKTKSKVNKNDNKKLLDIVI